MTILERMQIELKNSQIFFAKIMPFRSKDEDERPLYE